VQVGTTIQGCITFVLQKTGLSRETLYRTLSSRANPTKGCIDRIGGIQQDVVAQVRRRRVVLTSVDPRSAAPRREFCKR